MGKVDIRQMFSASAVTYCMIRSGATANSAISSWCCNRESCMHGVFVSCCRNLTLYLQIFEVTEVCLNYMNLDVYTFCKLSHYLLIKYILFRNASYLLHSYLESHIVMVIIPRDGGMPVKVLLQLLPPGMLNVFHAAYLRSRPSY
jgi:hypothetical protein